MAPTLPALAPDSHTYSSGRHRGISLKSHEGKLWGISEGSKGCPRVEGSWLSSGDSRGWVLEDMKTVPQGEGRTAVAFPSLSLFVPEILKPCRTCAHVRVRLLSVCMYVCDSERPLSPSLSDWVSLPTLRVVTQASAESNPVLVFFSSHSSSPPDDSSFLPNCPLLQDLLPGRPSPPSLPPPPATRLTLFTSFPFKLQNQEVRLLLKSIFGDVGFAPHPLPGPRDPLPTVSEEAALTLRQLHRQGDLATFHEQRFPAFQQTEDSVDNILLKYSVIMYLVATSRREKCAYESIHNYIITTYRQLCFATMNSLSPLS